MLHAHEASPQSTQSDEVGQSRTLEGGKRVRALAAAFILVTTVVAASADYVVERGDTLSEIAARHGVSVADLAAANGIRNPDLIITGQMLVIPDGAGGQSGAFHLVARGESLRTIAEKYRVTIAALVEANDIANPHLIRVGTELVIPNSEDKPSAEPSEDAHPEAVATYTVKKGDSLASIAARYDTTVDALAAANGITNYSLIYAGTTLRLSGPAFVAQSSTDGSYTVKAGDKLGSIASTYGLSLSALANANNISNVNVIRIGQVLVIPGKSSGWHCPVEGAKYINDWGFPRSGGRTHQGNDLFASRGSPVYAPVSGTVTFLNGRLGGLQFWLKGDDGNTYIGTHMDTVGDPGYVTAGTKLGTVGNTGNAITTSPHLHFEIHPGHGAAANPYPTLKENGC
ncbi:MAG TPA: LysM peptidoglycan-binding domain-containing protein [Acidimicrobiia bacterium]|nr:LysM peptidoglycan-binding domain-containing protein [Acidimicrobiia bacterium]